MFDIFFAGLLFLIAVFSHLSYCRKRPKDHLHAKSFVRISIFFWIVYLASVTIFEHFQLFKGHSFWNMPLEATGAFIFILMIPIYLVFYILTQLMSPSKKVLLRLEQNKELGFPDLLGCVQEENFIGTRLKQLKDSGHVLEKNQKFFVTASGKRSMLLLKLMRTIFKRDIGG